jgi:DNA-binding ferritin-like protein
MIAQHNFAKTKEFDMVITEDLKVFSRMNKQVNIECDSNRSPAASLIALCFKARTAAHFAHLQTQSFAEHKALEQFYTEIIPLADSFAEAYQGRFGIIGEYPSVKIKAQFGYHIVETVRDWIDEHRSTCGTQSELQNIIDEILSLCDSVIYKLCNLK